MISTATAELLIFIFSITLHIFAIPILLDENAAVPRIQSLMTTISLFIIGMAYMRLELFLPSLSILLGCIVWALTFIYRPTNGRWLGIENIIKNIKS